MATSASAMPHTDRIDSSPLLSPYDIESEAKPADSTESTTAVQSPCTVQSNSITHPSPYLVCLLLSAATAVVTSLIFWLYAARGEYKAYHDTPDHLESVLCLVFPLLFSSIIKRIGNCLPWFMARTFHVKEVTDNPVTFIQLFYTWFRWAPTSYTSSIFLVTVWFFLTFGFEVFAVYWLSTIFYSSSWWQDLAQPLNAVLTFSSFFSLSIFMPYVFTSKHSIGRVDERNASTDTMAPFWTRIFGNPFSYFSLGCFIMLVAYHSSTIPSTWFLFWEPYDAYYVQPTLWIGLLISLMIEYGYTFNSTNYVNHPGYTLGLVLCYQLFPISMGQLFLYFLAPSYKDANSSVTTKVIVYLTFFCILLISQYALRIIASRSVSPRLASLFLYGARVFEDVISDLSFLELHPFTPVFFLTSGLHICKTIIRDLDLLVNFSLLLRRLAFRAWYYVTSNNYYANQIEIANLYLSDVTVLSRWHYQYDRFYIRHDNFISELSGKLMVLCVLLADYFVDEYGKDTQWNATITIGLSPELRFQLVLAVLYLLVSIVITHFLILRLLVSMESSEEKERFQIATNRATTEAGAELGLDSNSISLPPVSIHRRTSSPPDVEVDISLQLTTQDAWSSWDFKCMFIIGTALFGFLACRFAFLAQIGWKTMQDNQGWTKDFSSTGGEQQTSQKITVGT